MTHSATLLTYTLVALISIVVASGCAFRPDRQQGQIITSNQLLQIEKGMYQLEVSALLGKPLLKNPFRPHFEWIYPYQLLKEDDTVIFRHVLIRFSQAGQVNELRCIQGSRQLEQETSYIPCSSKHPHPDFVEIWAPPPKDITR